MTRDVLATWLRFHHLTPIRAAIYVSACAVAALSCHWGLPDMADQASDGWEVLQVVGIGLTAAVGSSWAMLVSPEKAWVYALSDGRIRHIKAVWFFGVLGALTCTSSLCGALLLPSSIPLGSGFVTSCILWWSVSTVVQSFTGARVGLLTPLALVLLHLVRLVPWEMNVIFNPMLTEARLWATAALTFTAFVAHVRRQPRLEL